MKYIGGGRVNEIYLLYVGRTDDNSVYIGEKRDSRIINWWQVCPLIFILVHG